MDTSFVANGAKMHGSNLHTEFVILRRTDSLRETAGREHAPGGQYFGDDAANTVHRSL